MRGHSVNELRSTGDILAPDGIAVLLSGVCLGVTDLTGKRLEQAQLIATETSHMILFHAGDVASVLTASCYVTADGTTYIADYLRDPRFPRPGMWTELYCHVENGGS